MKKLRLPIQRCGVLLGLCGVSVMILLLITACLEKSDGGPQTDSNSLPGIIDAQIWSDRRSYAFGDTVTLGITLTNVSKDRVTLQSQSGTIPIVDIEVEAIRNAGENPILIRWSEENPNKIQHTLSLASGEAYAITWTLRLPIPGIYYARGWWADSYGRWKMLLSLEYGSGHPNP